PAPQLRDGDLCRRPGVDPPGGCGRRRTGGRPAAADSLAPAARRRARPARAGASVTGLLAGLGDSARWFLDPAHWQGAAGVPTRVFEHLVLSVFALVVAAAIGLPVGIGVGHTGRGASLAVNLANLGRALPTLAVMGIVL